MIPTKQMGYTHLDDDKGEMRGYMKQWKEFSNGYYNEIDVRNFIQENYTPYEETTPSWKVPLKQRSASGTIPEL